MLWFIDHLLLHDFALQLSKPPRTEAQRGASGKAGSGTSDCAQSTQARKKPPPEGKEINKTPGLIFLFFFLFSLKYNFQKFHPFSFFFFLFFVLKRIPLSVQTTLGSVSVPVGVPEALRSRPLALRKAAKEVNLRLCQSNTGGQYELPAAKKKEEKGKETKQKKTKMSW